MDDKLNLIQRVMASNNLMYSIGDEDEMESEAELREDLAEIGQSVVEQFEQDLESRSDWEDQNNKWMKLATQVMEDKSTPWPNASNVKYPLLSTASLQFHARAYPAIINDGRVAKCKVNGQQSEQKSDRAHRIANHLNYQVIDQMEEWQEDMDRMMYILPILGLSYKKTYYSSLKGRNKSDLVLARDLVINYHATDYYRAIKTHRMYLDSNEMYELQKSGFYADIELAPPTYKEHEGITDELTGLSPTDSDPEGDMPYEILEAHTWYDLDEDGYKEPVIITVDYDSKKVLRIAHRYENKDIRTNDNGDIVSIEATEYFTPYKFLPNPESAIYALGFGSLIGPINSAVNTTINQLLDAGTLSNMQVGLLAKGVRIPGGALRFKPGEWKTVQTTGDDLRKGVFPLPVQAPSATLFSLLQMLIDAGERLSSVKDIMVGENPGQNQPFRTTAAVLEQGMKVFVGIYKRIYRSLTQELRRLYALNSIYLDEAEYFSLNDGVQTEVGLSDYKTKDLSVIPGADPNIVSRELEVMKANSLLQKMQMGMNLNMQEVTKRVLEAEQHQDIQALTNVSPPPPPLDDLRKHAELNHKIEYDWATLQAKIDEQQYSAFKEYTQAIKNLASADATKTGIDQKNAQMVMQTLQIEHQKLMDVFDRQRQVIAEKQAQQEAGQQPEQAPQGEMPPPNQGM